MSTTDEAAIFVDKIDQTKTSQASSAFFAWKYLVNKYLELTSEESKERIEHLMKPLQAFNSQTNDMCTIKFKIWWDIIVALETRVEKFVFVIIYNFLTFCFGSVSDTCEHCDSFSPNVCKIHCTVCCNPELNFTVDSLKKISCIDAKYLSNALAQLLCLKCEPPRKRYLLRQLQTPLLSLPVHFQAMSKLLLHCVGKCTVLLVTGQCDPKLKMYALRKIWMNLMNQIKRIEKIPPTSAQDLPKAIKHCAKAEVFKNLFCILSKLCEISTENENLVNTCLSPVLETVLSKKNGLSKEILTSEIYYCGPGDPRAPLYTMLDILLSPSFVGIKNHKHEELFLTLLNRLFELGIGPEHSTVIFVQEVIKKLDMALSTGTSIHPKILKAIWNIIAKKFTVYLKSGQTIYRGNESDVDFKCLHLILIFPVANIEFFDHESIYKSWTQLFNAFQKNCRMHSVVENDVYDNIFGQLFQEVEIMNDMNYDEILFVMNLATTVLDKLPFHMVSNLHSTSTALTHSTCIHQSLKLLHLLLSKTTNLTGRNDMYFKIMSLFAKCSAMFCKNLQVWVPKNFILSLEDFINFLLNVNVNHPEALLDYVKIMRTMWNCFLNNFVKNVAYNNFDNDEVSTLQAVIENSFSFPDHEIHIISMKFLLSENWYFSLEMNKCMLCGDCFKRYKEIKSIVCKEKYNWKELEERKKYLIQKVQNFFLDTEEVAISHENNDNDMEQVENRLCEREMEPVGFPSYEREMEQVEILPCERENVSPGRPEPAYPDTASEVLTDSPESTRETEMIEEIPEETFQEVTDMERDENLNTLCILSHEVFNSAGDFVQEHIAEEKRTHTDSQQNNEHMVQCDNIDLTALTDYTSDVAENIVNEENAETKNSHKNLTTPLLPLTDAQFVSEDKRTHLNTQQNNTSVTHCDNRDLLTVLTDYSNEITESILNEENAERNSQENLPTCLLSLTNAQPVSEDKRTHLNTQQNNKSATQNDSSDLLTFLTICSNENIVNEENAERENSHENDTTSLLPLIDAQPISEDKWTDPDIKYKKYFVAQADNNSDSLIVVSNKSEGITDSIVNENIGVKHSHCNLTTPSFSAKQSTDDGGRIVISVHNENQFLVVKETDIELNESENELMHVPDVKKQYFKVTSETQQYEIDKGCDGKSEKYKNNFQKKKKKKNKHKKNKKREKNSLLEKLNDTSHYRNSTSSKRSRKAPLIIRIARIKEGEHSGRYYIKNLNEAENTEQQAPALTEDCTLSMDIRESNEIQSDIQTEEILNRASNFDIKVKDLVEKNKGWALAEMSESLLEHENSNVSMNENNISERNVKIVKNKESMCEKDHTLNNFRSSLIEFVSCNSRKPIDTRSVEENGKCTIEHEKSNICLKNVGTYEPHETRKSVIQENGCEEALKVMNHREENINSKINEEIVGEGFQIPLIEFEESNQLLNSTNFTLENNTNVALEIENETQGNKNFILTKTYMTSIEPHKSMSENTLTNNNIVENEKISLEEDKISSLPSVMEIQTNVSKEAMNDTESSSENVQISMVQESNSNENNNLCETLKLLLEFPENKSKKTQQNALGSKANINIAYQLLMGFQESIGERILKDYNYSLESISAIEDTIIVSKDCVGTLVPLMKFQESRSLTKDQRSNCSEKNITIYYEKYQPREKFMGMFKECSDFTYKDFQKKFNFLPLEMGKSLINFSRLNAEGMQKSVHNFLTTIFECKSSLTSQCSLEFESGFESKSLINKRTHLKKTYPQVLENESMEFSSSDSSLSTIIIQPSEVENNFDLIDLNYDTNINTNESRNIFTLNVDDYPIQSEIQKNSDEIFKNSHECSSNALSLKVGGGKIMNIATQQRKQHSQKYNFPFDKIKEFSVKCSLSSFKDTLKLFVGHERPSDLSTGALKSSYQGIVLDGLENTSSETESACSFSNMLCVCPSSKSFDPGCSKFNNSSATLQYFLQGLSQLFDWKTKFKIQDNSALVPNSIPQLLINNHDNSHMNITLSLTKEENQILINLVVKNNRNDDNNITMAQTYEFPIEIVNKFSCLSLQASLNAEKYQVPKASNCMEIECMHNNFKSLASQLVIKDSFFNDNIQCDLPSASSVSSSSFINSIHEVLEQKYSEIKISGENENSNRKCELQESPAIEGSSNVGNTIIESLCTNLNSDIEQLPPSENLKQSIIEGPPTLQKDQNQSYGELIDIEKIKYQLSSKLKSQNIIIKHLSNDENNLLPIQSPDSCQEVANNNYMEHESEIDKMNRVNSEIKNGKESETHSHAASLHNVRVCCTRKRSFPCSLRSNAGNAITRNLRKRKTERNVFTKRCTLECCSWMDKGGDMKKKTVYVRDSKTDFQKTLFTSLSNPKLCEPDRHNINKLNVGSLINANEKHSSLVRENEISSEEKRTRIFTRKKTCFLCDHPETSKCNTVKFIFSRKDSCKNPNNEKKDTITSKMDKTLKITKYELNDIQITGNISSKNRITKREKVKQIMICEVDTLLQANTNKGSRFENKMTFNNLHSKKRKCKAMFQDSSSLELEQALINEPGTLIKRITEENTCENFSYSKKLKKEMITNSVLASTESVIPVLEDISRSTSNDYCTRKRKLCETEPNEVVVKLCRLELKQGSCLQGKEELYIVTDKTSSVSVKVTKYDDINLNSESIQKQEIASDTRCFEPLKNNVNDALPAIESTIKEDNVSSQLSLKGKKDLYDDDDSSSIKNLEEGFKDWGYDNKSNRSSSNNEYKLS